MFKFTVVAIPGAHNFGPDAISRIPLPSSRPLSSPTPVIASTSEIESTLEAMVTDDPMRGPVHMKRVLDVSTHDREYQDLLQTIRNGFPGQKNDVPINLREFWPLLEELYTVKELVFLQGKVLIPQPLRKLLLDYLHEGHQGIVAMKENARRRFFWPGMSKQIQNRRYQCRTCNEKAPSQARETPISPTLPSYPFQHAATDIFNMAGRKFLVYTDRFSSWTETASTYPDAKASTICNILRRYFITFGVPEEISADGGPPFDSREMRIFLKEWGVRYRLSSAYFPQSNGRAEVAVKTMKRILSENITPSGSLDTDAVARALLLHRNTPPPDIGASPSELLFGRHLTDHLVRFCLYPTPHCRKILQANLQTQAWKIAAIRVNSPNSPNPNSPNNPPSPNHNFLWGY